MMWVEILSRHREIAARFRITGSEARIGRGYDNDVIVDDPYVAAQHLRVFRDEAGQLVAEDLGSANGVFLDGSTTRLARFTLDGKQPIRIGQTWLRIRDAAYAVEPERVAQRELRALPIGIAAVLCVAVLGYVALDLWLEQTSEPKASTYLTPLLTLAGVTVGWVGAWSLLSRIFSGRSHFLRNLIIASAGMLVLTLYFEFSQFAAFAWTWSTAGDYGYAVGWMILAAVCILHLREIGRSRLWLKGGLVAALFAVVIAVQTLQMSEAYSDSGRQYTVRRLLPPTFRLVRLQDESAFFAEIAALRTKLERDRAQRSAEQSGR